jgi:hypothetical protein
MKKYAQADLESILANMPDDFGAPSGFGGRRGGSRKKRTVPASFPDYGRSLVTQNQADPQMAGLLRALGYGTAGGVIGAGAGKLGGLDSKSTMLASIISALIAGVPGYYSGKHDQQSNNSKLLFLRRLGIDNPGELEAMEAYPNMVNRISAKGEKV